MNENKTINAFLLIGQSNMAGRGNVGDVLPIENKSCFMLRMGRWQPMSEPINPDRGIFTGKYRSGVCLAASFADGYAKATGEPAGLIPCADGGTSIDQWREGGELFDHAVMMTRLALRNSRLCGILWHQGEADCTDDARVDSYKEKFIRMAKALRRELSAKDVPILIGELSHSYTIGDREFADRPERLNSVFYEISCELPKCAVISSEGLTMKADGLHFDARSLRIFGERYLDGYFKLKADNINNV